MVTVSGNMTLWCKLLQTAVLK